METRKGLSSRRKVAEYPHYWFNCAITGEVCSEYDCVFDCGSRPLEFSNAGGAILPHPCTPRNPESNRHEPSPAKKEADQSDSISNKNHALNDNVILSREIRKIRETNKIENFDKQVL